MSIQNLEVKVGGVYLHLSLDEEVLQPTDVVTAMKEACEALHIVVDVPADEVIEPVGEPDVVEVEPEVEPEVEEEKLSPQQKAARTRAKNKADKEAKAAKEAEEADADEDISIDGDDGDDGDEISIGDPVEEHDDITDAELQAEVNAKAKELKKAGREDYVMVIKSVIEAFNTDDEENFTAGSMTQAQRRKFLAKLNALEA